MSNYGQRFQRTTSLTMPLGVIYNAASSPRRIALYFLDIGSPATPADQAILLEVQLSTAAPTGGTSRTPEKLDEADAAATSLAMESPTAITIGTPPAGTKLSLPFNAKATYLWNALPGKEIVCAATAGHGYAFQTPISTALQSTYMTAHWEER